MYSFIETKIFSRLVVEYLADEEYTKLQRTLIEDPEAGDLIPGSGRVRKLRWGVAGRGKRGGIRVILLRSHTGRSHLDAHAVRKERDGEHLRQGTSPDQGGD